MSSSPRVSIVIPTFNRRRFVHEAIDSALAQTYTDFELIVVDDGSTDGTCEALEICYGNRIRYIWQENQGESAARNRGIEMASGEYVALLDSDDKWLPDKLAKQVAALDLADNAVLAFSQAWLMDETGQVLEPAPQCSNIQETDLTLEALCIHNKMGPAASTVMIRSHMLQAVGGFDESLQYGEDWDLWLRLRTRGGFIFLDEPLALYRKHRGSQYHRPLPETVDSRLNGQIRMLHRALANWPTDTPAGLEEHALAAYYSEAAYFDYLIGRSVLGQARFRRAMAYDATYHARLPTFGVWLVSEAVAFASLTDESVSDTHSKVNSALENWPGDRPMPSSEKSRFLAQLYVGLSFAAHKKRDFALLRYCLSKVIRFNPLWLLNFGIWSIGLDGFLGPEFADWLRAPFRYMRRDL